MATANDSNDALDELDVSITPAPSELTIVSFNRLHQKAAYAVGHVLNDLTASMWFTYLLLYFNYVKQFGPTMAGELLLVGQVVDAAVTPFIGLESDKNLTFWFCGTYGKRKSWHLIGTVAVLASFPFIFSKSSWCDGADRWADFFYYSVFIVIFQFGWASTQISHLSLIPELTSLPNERVCLNAFRYTFTIVSNILVYLVTWFTLSFHGETSDPYAQIGPADADSFQLIVIIIVAIGVICSVTFHVFVPDPGRESQQNDALSEVSGFSLDRSVQLNWKQWFRESQFYATGLLYMATRLYVNLSQVFIGLYVQKTLQLPKSSIAVIPLVMFVSGLMVSCPINLMAKRFKLRTIYALGVGCAGVAVACILIRSESATYKTHEVYVVASLIGIASAILLVTSLAITNELIGESTSSGAFVFGALSFLDKLSNGVAVIVIEALHDCESCISLPLRYYYQYVMVYACGGAAALGLIALLILSQSQQTDRRKNLMNRTPINQSYADLNECFGGAVVPTN